MNRFLSFATLAIAVLLLLAGASGTVPAQPVARFDPLEISIEIAPSHQGPYELLQERHPEMFPCTAILRDADSGTIVAPAVVTLAPGSEGSRTVTLGDLSMTLAAKIKSARTGAVADLTVWRRGRLIAHQKSTLLLAESSRTPRF